MPPGERVQLLSPDRPRTPVEAAPLPAGARRLPAAVGACGALGPGLSASPSPQGAPAPARGRSPPRRRDPGPPGDTRPRRPHDGSGWLSARLVSPGPSCVRRGCCLGGTRPLPDAEHRKQEPPRGHESRPGLHGDWGAEKMEVRCRAASRGSTQMPRRPQGVSGAPGRDPGL